MIMCCQLVCVNAMCIGYWVGRVALLLLYEAVECVQGAQRPFSGLTREYVYFPRVKFTSSVSCEGSRKMPGKKKTRWAPSSAVTLSGCERPHAEPKCMTRCYRLSRHQKPTLPCRKSSSALGRMSKDPPASP